MKQMNFIYIHLVATRVKLCQVTLKHSNLTVVYPHWNIPWKENGGRMAKRKTNLELLQL